MNLNKILCLFALLAFFSINASARKPAVEDFVGVETEDYRPGTGAEGTEVLFDFGNLVEKKQVQQTNQFAGNWFSLVMVVAFISLPALMWFGITGASRTGKKSSSTTAHETNEETNTTMDTSNVEYLGDYQDKKKSGKDNDDIKKAS